MMIDCDIIINHRIFGIRTLYKLVDKLVKRFEWFRVNPLGNTTRI